MNYFFHGVCVLCGRSLSGIDEIKYSLCGECRVSINPVQGDKCRVCGKPLISEDDICVPCRKTEALSENNEAENDKQKNSFDRLWVLFPYTGNFRRLLSAYKFKKTLPLAGFFCAKIIDCISENPVLRNAVIVPVPPRPGKIKHSGWDQVDYLVKRLKKLSRANLKSRGPEEPIQIVSVSRCLKRGKSKIQKQLNRKDRIENLKNRIYAGSRAPETALVIDDVITTGSTMEICAKALKEAGALNVYGLCLFYD